MNRRLYRRCGKRVVDLLGAAALLLCVAPLMAVIAAVLRVVQSGPVIFRQPRPGLHGRAFVLMKFKTMTDAVDELGRPCSDAQRVTSFGRFLRSTSLDELPELINVLRGEMSLVGPRPLLVEYLPRYSAFQARRHEVKPGLTGWAQIHGRNALSWDDKFRLDVWYVDNVSCGLDLKILAATVWKVLTREGVSEPGHATAREFLGNH